MATMHAAAVEPFGQPLSMREDAIPASGRGETVVNAVCDRLEHGAVASRVVIELAS